MIEIGTILQDRYRIEEQIGAGGMGAVYRAIDQRFGNPVAIKETFYKDEELSDAFEREAHLLNSLLHPVLPHVSDYFSENNGHFLVMQFIEGEDLFLTLKREGAFPVQNVVRWTDSLLDALDYSHSQNPPIIHRDIKPQNLKITPRGDVILLDFGLAKLNSTDTQGALSVFGYSRTYSPLEQIQGTGTDARSDIFALGATAFHLLTGTPPIDALARASAIVAGETDPLRLASDINKNVPVSVATVIRSALALNPSQRFISAVAMRLALQHAASSDLANKMDYSPAPVQSAATLGNVVVDHADTTDFAALDSFAVDENSQRENLILNNDLEAFRPPPEIENTVRINDNLIKTAYTNDAGATYLRSGKSQFPLKALASVFILVGLAAGYFIIKANSSGKTEEPTVLNSVQQPNLEVEKSSRDSVTDNPNASASTATEITEKTKSASPPKKTTVEKTEVLDEEEPEDAGITENPIPETDTRETSASKSIRNFPRPPAAPRRKSAITPDETETQTVPDIESIFTGRSSTERIEKGRGNRQESREDRENMSDEELKESRRQRRKERRERQNIPPFPF